MQPQSGPRGRHATTTPRRVLDPSPFARSITRRSPFGGWSHARIWFLLLGSLSLAALPNQSFQVSLSRPSGASAPVDPPPTPSPRSSPYPSNIFASPKKQVFPMAAPRNDAFQTSRELKVEDALLYLDQVRDRCDRALFSPADSPRFFLHRPMRAMGRGALDPFDASMLEPPPTHTFS